MFLKIFIVKSDIILVLRVSKIPNPFMDVLLVNIAGYPYGGGVERVASHQVEVVCAVHYDHCHY